MKVRDLIDSGLVGAKYSGTAFALKSSWNGAIIYRSWLRRTLPNDDMMNMEISRLATGLYNYKDSEVHYGYVEIWVRAYDYQHRNQEE